MIRRVLGFPLVWFVVGVGVIVIVDGVLTSVGSELGTPFLIAGSLVGAAASVGIYLLTMRVLARRRVPELRTSVITELAMGVALGAVFALSSILVVVALGGYSVQWHPVDVGRTVSIAVAVNLGAAVVEELACRGLAMQAIEELGGTWMAVAVTALMFGGAHFLNPSATVWSSLAIATESGVMLGAAFAWRRSLWFVIGVHFAWNTTEGLLGIPVSGHDAHGLFLTVTHGNVWLTGGAFGLEASVVPLAMSVVLTVLMVLAWRTKGTHADSR